MMVTAEQAQQAGRNKHWSIDMVYKNRHIQVIQVQARIHNPHRHHQEFHKYHRYLRLTRPLAFLFNLIVIYLLFSWVGYKVIGIIFAGFLIVKEIIQLTFFWRLEKRIFEPIVKLHAGVQEIAKGNYNVTIESHVENEIGLLITSFNEMAQKLLASEKLKLDYEENRKTLIANISHDLKTPIAAIQGYIEAILDGTVTSPEKMDKYLTTISHNTDYVNKLIDDLLLFSQLDMNKLDFSFEEQPIQAFMHDLMEEFQFELEERGARLDYENRLEQNCLVRIDGKRFYQAMRNIIGNAVKYGPEKDLALSVKLTREGDFVQIAIRDNGPGIPGDKLEHIFERFYRIDSERTKDLMSSGLGLAIARELIEAHGGKIEAASREGQGSCFTLSLPIQDETGDNP
ncbi:MAG TPA: HAMP domain-containing sensor histidine kinase [Syntrophomonadaceae bacterium]|nr:HAMP domain-containing sensor histidine kinase [Syntrophomonadaceae bacterium]